MIDEPIEPLEMLKLLENQDYVASLRSGANHGERLVPNVDAVLAGIRFIYKFAQTPEGEAAIKKALDAGFFEVASVGAELRAVPRFIWPDDMYDGLCPGNSFYVAVGVAVGRHLLWGDPGIFDRSSPETLLQRAILKAVRCFQVSLPASPQNKHAPRYP